MYRIEIVIEMITGAIVFNEMLFFYGAIVFMLNVLFFQLLIFQNELLFYWSKYFL